MLNMISEFFEFEFLETISEVWVECRFVEVVFFATVLFVVFFGFQEFRPNSGLKSSNGSVPRRSNLSTQVFAVDAVDAVDAGELWLYDSAF